MSKPSRSTAASGAPSALEREVPLSAELRLVAIISLLLSVSSLLYCARRGWLLLYGDAVAHLHIARRVFDSLNPGYRQLGSVWLPLPHILLLPFVQSMDAWRTGLAGAWPSMACYVLGCMGMHRLARYWLPASLGAIVTLGYALNPGLLYFSTTAMTEPLFLALMIWSVVFLVGHRFATEAGDSAKAARSLMFAALALVAAIYTRYDGWIFAAAAWYIACFGFFKGRLRRDRRVQFGFAVFTVLLIAAPSLWLWYNAHIYGDPLDFMRGPYSARAIELRTTPPGAGHYPGWHNMKNAAIYYMKAAKLGAGWKLWGDLLLLTALLGSIAGWMKQRGRGFAIALLLWMPLPFYMYSIAYGSVPLFIPVWTPFSFYNTRYGMEMLPAFAFFPVMLLGGVRFNSGKWRAGIIGGVCALVMLNSVLLMRSRPLVLAEAMANSTTRIPFEKALATSLKHLDPGAVVLMYTSAHVGALEQAAIPLKQTINEGDWEQWQQALQAPAEAAEYVVAMDGDAVVEAVEKHPDGLELREIICTTGQPCARIYRSHAYRPGK